MKVRLENSFLSKPLTLMSIINFFLCSLLENKIIMRLERGPEEPKYKWPKKLYLSKVMLEIFSSINPLQDQSTQSDSAFYSFVINPKSKSSRLYTLLIIGAVIAVCLFQIWPLKLKLAVFYTSVILLYVLVRKSAHPEVHLILK